MKNDALRRYAMLFLILFIGRGWCKPFVNSLAAGGNEGEQGESRRRGDGMHSTKPIHTCSDVRMRPAFITLAGCIIGRPSAEMSDVGGRGGDLSPWNGE